MRKKLIKLAWAIMAIIVIVGMLASMATLGY